MAKMKRIKSIVFSEYALRFSYSNLRREKFFLIGTEIKRLREGNNLTLEELCCDLCSPSYLCKIENGNIEPNIFILRELCKRLSVNEEDFNFLLELEPGVTFIIHAYLTHDYELIKETFERGKNFENYRFQIVKMYYYLSICDYSNAEVVYNNLLSLLSNMLSADLDAFSIASAILNYHKFHFLEAIDDLTYLDKNAEKYDVKVLTKIVMFRCHAALNLCDTPKYFEDLKKLIFEKHSYNIIVEEKNIICYYYLKNDCISMLESEMEYIRDVKVYNSLLFLKDYKNDDVSCIVKYKNNDLDDFTSILRDLYLNRAIAIEKLNNYNDKYYDYRFDYLFLKYQIIPERNKLKFIFEEAIPRVNDISDNYLKKYFINEVANLSMYFTRYRHLLRAYLLLFDEDGLKKTKLINNEKVYDALTSKPKGDSNNEKEKDNNTK